MQCKKQKGGVMKTGQCRQVIMAALVGMSTAAALSALTIPARAGVVQLGTFSDALCTPNCSGSFTPSPAQESGTISDYYTFQVSSGLLLTIDSITSTFSVAGAQIQNFTLDVFKNSGSALAPIEDGAALTSVVASYISGAISGTQFGGAPSVLLDSGNYFFEVTGTTVGGAGDPTAAYSGSFSMAVSAVPEPATWGMLLLGFLGLGFAFRKSVRKVSFA